MREFLGIDKALTRIKGELSNNASKLTEIDEIEDSPDLREHEQRVKAIITDLKEERAKAVNCVAKSQRTGFSIFANTPNG